VHFLRPVSPGRILGQGRILRREGDVAVIEATLFDSEDAAVSTATATARVIPLDQARDPV
jgi:acyl-coenzyme A thioesterase PaaI-like protein